MKAPKTKPKATKAKPSRSTARKAKSGAKRATKRKAAKKPERAKPERDVVVPTKPKPKRKPAVKLPTMAAFQAGLDRAGACGPARDYYDKHGLERGYETMPLGYFGWAAWRFYGVKRTRSLFRAVAEAVGRDLHGSEPWYYSEAGVEHAFDDLAKGNRAEARRVAKSILPFEALMQRIATYQRN